MSDLFKIVFERVEDGKTATFFINGIDPILSAEFFNHKIVSAKTSETYTMKEQILKQLDKPISHEKNLTH